MQDQGFLRGAPRGDLRDVIGRSHEEGSVVAVAPDDTLAVAHARMRLYDVSQLPVLEGERIVGIVDEYDLLLACVRDAAAFARPVREVMSSRLETVPPDAPLGALLPVFERGLVPIVVEGERFLGLVTRIDVVNYLRRRLA